MDQSGSLDEDVFVNGQILIRTEAAKELSRRRVILLPGVQKRIETRRVDQDAQRRYASARWRSWSLATLLSVDLNLPTTASAR